ncbi:MAG TPA: MFS transporter [Acetobacteraceae bacterium]|nr:MFS transporter [Acetobacteraceae bacterium]
MSEVRAAAARPMPTAAAQPTTIRWRLFLFIFVVTVVNMADRTSISVGMPTIAKEFALSPAMQGVILSSFFWTYALLQIPSGWMIDRAGPSRVMSVGILLWGVCQTLAMATVNGTTLLLTRLGLGAAEAPMFPAGGKLVALWMARHERGRGAVLMDSGSYFGAALGGVTIAWLIYVLGSWRLAFGIAGSMTLLLGVVAWRFLRDNPANHPAVNRAELDHIQTVLPAAGSVAAAPRRFSWLRVAPIMAGRFGWAMMNFGLLTWGPSYLAQARHLDLKQMGSATFIIFAGGFLGSLTSGFLSDALQRQGLRQSAVLKGMLTLSGLAMFSAFLALPSISDVILAVAVLTATEFMLCWGSLYWTFPGLLVPAAQVGMVGGLMNFAGSAGGVVVPLIAGFILQLTGSYDGVLYFFAGCAVLFILGTVVIPFGRLRHE